MMHPCGRRKTSVPGPGAGVMAVVHDTAPSRFAPGNGPRYGA